MPFNGSGVYDLPNTTVTPALADTTIDNADFNTLTADLETALTKCYTKTGESSATANLPMGGFKHTGVAASSALTDYARVTEYQNGDHVAADAGGAADVQTLAVAPSITAYNKYQRFSFVPVADNTGACTLNVSSVGAKDIKLVNGEDPSAGDLDATGISEVIYDGTNFVLLNPATATGQLRPSTLTIAKALTPVDGVEIFPQGTDGGEFVGGTGKALGYYDDNGGAYYGSRFKPTAGDGTSGWERKNPYPFKNAWFGIVGDGTADNAAAVQAIGDAAHAVGGCIVEFDPGSYLFSSQVAYTGWRGVTFQGVGSTAGWASADAGGGGPTNTGKSTEFLCTTDIVIMYGTQGNSGTDRTRRLAIIGINFTGNNSALASGNYAIHWHQDDVAVFAGIVNLEDCMFYNFENGIRVTTITGVQATGWWRIVNCYAQSCYWGIYAPGGINSCQIEGGLYYQNNNDTATSDVINDPYGGGIYATGTGWKIDGVDIESNAAGIYLDQVNGFDVGTRYSEQNNVAQIIIKSSKNGTINSSNSTDEIIVSNSQAINFSQTIAATIRVNGQCRNLRLPSANVVYDNAADLTPDNKNISVEEKDRYELTPKVFAKKEIRCIVDTAPAGTATVNNASTDITSPFAGPICTGITTTSTSQYVRTYLSNGAWALNQYVSGIMYLYIPTALTGTLSISLIGSGGTEVSAALGLYSRDVWFPVILRSKVAATSTYTDFRITIGSTAQTLYMYRPTALITDRAIDPFITNKFSDAVDTTAIDPVMLPGNTMYVGGNKITWGYVGTPEGALVGRVGDICMTDGSVAGPQYNKDSGAGTNTGWVAK